MSYEADLIADRRRLRGRVTVWRVLAFVALLAVIVLGSFLVFGDGISRSRPHVARININGVITGDQRTIDLINDVRKNDAVRAVLLRIDSPGGTTAGSEMLYDSLRRLSEEKPVVAVVGALAASGGYIAALGADRIVALETSLVGSIGVLFQYPDLTRLMDTIGVSVEEVKSSPLKAAPSPFEQTSPAAREALESLVRDSFDWFKRLVRERRDLDDTQLALVADGRVFTGNQGVGLRLVDQIGGEREARAWLTSEKKIDNDLPVREWRRRSRREALDVFSAGAFVARTAGLDDLAAAVDRLGGSIDARRLDGLLALWHPEPQK
ncbi:signal peptide peptidase SppA [Pseudochelatococcus contaminans]|uniref:Protease-4 n=1 Tax=Pseudochelatococcus contaminans TaxID=1538103 RepID=A0A7W6EH07_9HYPH|nr:signal peptide peptidase SppA [Pseudochelatococcus contaminans]MBB3809765.1 protease-4 [Pseudochelatococcus contaminans]